MLQKSTIQFLKNLTKNNNKDWFDKNRSSYEDAKSDFSAFIQDVIDAHAKKDPDIQNLLAKNCLFRINRDIRFSKDKSPYKTNFGASIVKGGKKSPFAGYYFHLQPGESFVGGGLWMPTPDALGKVRQEIDYNLKEFKKILTAKSFSTAYGTLYEGDEYKLTRVPKGYQPDNPAAEYLKFKNFVAMQSLTEKDLTGPELRKKTLKAFSALQPLLNFINRAIE